MTTNLQHYAAAIQQFATDLDNSISMEDRKASIDYLAAKIGVGRANIIAEMFGLTDSYYRAQSTMPTKADYLAALGPCGK